MYPARAASTSTRTFRLDARARSVGLERLERWRQTRQMTRKVDDQALSRRSVPPIHRP